jgi:hypothetical protein
MTEFVLEEGQEFALIPEGEVLAAEVIACEVRETPFDDEKNPGQKQKEVSFRFQITEQGDYHARHVFGRTPTTFNTNDACKLRQWVQELLGMDKLPENFRFNTDTLIGLPCRVSVAQRTSKPSTANPRGKTSNYVFDVLRVNSGSLLVDDPF